MGSPRRRFALVEEEGLEALTTRRLTKRLGVEGPSLYNHIASRDDLLDEMTAVIDERLDPGRLDHSDWRVGLAEYARAHWRAFLVRPELVATIASRPVRSDVALRAYDAAFAASEQPAGTSARPRRSWPRSISWCSARRSRRSPRASTGRPTFAPQGWSRIPPQGGTAVRCAL